MAKLNPIKNNFNIVDPITNEVKCDFNSCCKKFVEKVKEEVYFGFENSHKRISNKHYHECSECSIVYWSKTDKSKTWVNRRASPRLPVEENDIHEKFKRVPYNP